MWQVQRKLLLVAVSLAASMFPSGCSQSTLAGNKEPAAASWTVTLGNDALRLGVPSSLDHGFVYVPPTGYRWLVSEITVRNNTRSPLRLNADNSRFMLRALTGGGDPIALDWSQIRNMAGALALPQTFRAGARLTGDLVFSVPSTFDPSDWVLVYEYVPTRDQSPAQISFVPLETHQANPA